jgi:hypothetical protein
LQQRIMVVLMLAIDDRDDGDCGGGEYSDGGGGDGDGCGGGDAILMWW